MVNSPIKITSKDLPSLSYMLLEAMRKIANSDLSDIDAPNKMASIAKDAIIRSGNEHLLE